MWRRTLKATSGLAALLLIGVTGCVDLAVNNPNAAGTSTVLSKASDVENLIGGAYSRYLHVESYYGPTMALSNMAGQHAAPWANAGMEKYARIPRVPTANTPGDGDIDVITYAWANAYRAIAAVHDGLAMVDSGAVDLGSDKTMIEAYGKYMVGLALGTIALVYDSGFVYTESVDPASNPPLQSHTAVMTAALAELDAAGSLASGATFTLPSSFMGSAVSSTVLAQLAHTYAAIFRADVARSAAERQAADWTQIVADANAGITADWMRDFDCNSLGHFCANDFSNDDWVGLAYIMADGWQMQNNWVMGMADTSGAYQAWVPKALAGTLTQDDVPLFITPDTRWPSGTTDADQHANPGEYFIDQANDNGTWARPDRGIWRWSYYQQVKEPFYTALDIDGSGSIPEVTAEALASLKAEAAYYGKSGTMQDVVDFINATRTQHGLNATNLAGLNTSCVPRMPPTHPTNPGGCGDLWEMFKWETRLETIFTGPLAVGFYFDSRGWGDLMEGTDLQFPVPYTEMQILQKAPYDLGGVGGNSGAPMGAYGY